MSLGKRASAAIVLASASLAACDPVSGMHVSVRSAPPCGAPAPASYEDMPYLADVRVSVRCPNGDNDRVRGRTNAEGQMGLRYVGLLGRRCSLIVEKEGYETQTFPVEEVCTSFRDDSYCHGIVITADLVPSAAPAAPAR